MQWTHLLGLPLTDLPVFVFPIYGSSPKYIRPILTMVHREESVVHLPELKWVRELMHDVVTVRGASLILRITPAVCRPYLHACSNRPGVGHVLSCWDGWQPYQIDNTICKYRCSLLKQ